MNKIILFSLLSLGTLCFGQKKQYDKNITGCYRGSEQNQQVDGVSKYWVSCRLDQGKSILLFVAIHQNGEVTQTTENGKWWTNNGKYYELHENDNVTDVYDYKVLENGDVSFKSTELMGRKDNSYEFVDYKVSED